MPSLVDCDDGKRIVFVPDVLECGAEENRFGKVDRTADPLTSSLRTLRKSRFCTSARGRIFTAAVVGKFL